MLHIIIIPLQTYFYDDLISGKSAQIGFIILPPPVCITQCGKIRNSSSPKILREINSLLKTVAFTKSLSKSVRANFYNFHIVHYRTKYLYSLRRFLSVKVHTFLHSLLIRDRHMNFNTSTPFY